MELQELIRNMEKAERVWPDDRPWAISMLATYLQMDSRELLGLFSQINPTLDSERDQVMPEDLRLLKAHCERMYEQESGESLEEKRREQAKARKNIQSLLPKIGELMAQKALSKALNTYIYMLGECGEVATPEEKAQWYEEMGRLCLKLKRHPNEAARYFRSAVFALSLLEDTDGIRDLLETYEEDFDSDEAQRSWQLVAQTGKESLSKLDIQAS